MNTQKGFLSVTAAIIIGLVVLGGIGYVVMNPEVFQKKSSDNDANISTEPSIAWKFEEGVEVNNVPHTVVSVVINGETHLVSTFAGSCSEVGASGGVDGKGLLVGELSAVQCWFAGGGDEIGVFAEEDGTIVVMVGVLDEGSEEVAPFRGDFRVRSDLRF